MKNEEILANMRIMFNKKSCPRPVALRTMTKEWYAHEQELVSLFNNLNFSSDFKLKQVTTSYSETAYLCCIVSQYQEPGRDMMRSHVRKINLAIRALSDVDKEIRESYEWDWCNIIYSKNKTISDCLPSIIDDLNSFEKEIFKLRYFRKAGRPTKTFLSKSVRILNDYFYDLFLSNLKSAKQIEVKLIRKIKLSRHERTVTSIERNIEILTANSIFGLSLLKGDIKDLRGMLKLSKNQISTLRKKMTAMTAI